MKPKMKLLLLWLLGVTAVKKATGDVVKKFLPPQHLQYDSLSSKYCWGHEKDCPVGQSFSHNVTSCTVEGDRQTFFDEADFGYVGTKLATIDHLCRPQLPGDSELLCTSQMQFCTGRQIYADFRNVPMDRLIQYSIDVLSYGEIGGRCKVKQDFIAANSNYMSALQSWAPEMRNFAKLEPVDSEWCDLTFEEPVIVMKIDATVNMYHHFCDFFNLYASLHLNATLESEHSFDRDVRVLIWENQPYRSAFLPAFNVFTKHPIMSLADVAGKKACFKKIMFPLPPRMVFGLYYNTPLTTVSCQGSGLFKAFSEFLPFRMGMEEVKKPDQRLRVTILNRKTPYRNIVNLDEIVSELSPHYQVTVANFSHHRPPFKLQMERIRQTDILIGIHGAGLTHMLFLPEWAAVFELYDCEDPECYRDLAMLRGLKHLSWTDRTKLTPVASQQGRPGYEVGSAVAKFQDYRFDPKEVLRLTNTAKDHVLNHRSFNEPTPPPPQKNEL